MRFLFLTNFYPPADLGGWEQWCQEIAVEFRRRGHEVSVLASRFRRTEVQDVEPSINRDLYLESDLHRYNPFDFFLRFPLRDKHNKQTLRETIDAVRPDIVMIWGMWQLSPELAALAEEMCPGRVLYYLCGFWPIPELEADPHTIYWQRHHFPFGRFALRQLTRHRSKRPKCQYAGCVSRFVLDTYLSHGFDFADGRLIYGGIDTTAFIPGESKDAYASAEAVPQVKLLFAGTISKEKGADTALQALGLLAQKYGPELIQLSVVGSGPPAFVHALQRYVQEKNLGEYVTFHERIPKEQMAELFRQHDVLLFTSTWEEPLARMMMEGLASALVVISTPTGGSKEAIEHGQNGLLYKSGDAADLATQVAAILEDPELACRLADNGRQTAVDRFDFQRMADEIESFSLERAAATRRSGYVKR